MMAMVAGSVAALAGFESSKPCQVCFNLLSPQRASGRAFVPKNQLVVGPNVACRSQALARRRASGLQERTGDSNLKERVSVPPASFVAAMGASGALLGPVLDGFHSRFGVLRYHDPAPFAVMLGNVELCQTAAWVPPLFGIAGMLIGTLYILLDQALDTKEDRRRVEIWKVLLGIACFIAQYYASGLLLGTHGVLGPGIASGPENFAWWLVGASELFLWVTALAHWRFFDGTKAGIIVAALTALGGPAIEVLLLNFPGWDLYAYAAPDLFGIPTWIAPVYWCGAPAVGNLARFVRQSILQ